MECFTKKYQVLSDQLDQVLSQSLSTDCPDLIAIGERFTAQVRLKMMQGGGPYSAQASLEKEEFLDIKQVARLLKIHVSSAYELARLKDGLPVMRMGRNMRVKYSDLLRWADEQKKNGVDTELDHWYSLQCRDRKSIQKAQKKNGADPSPIGRKVGRNFQHSRKMGTGSS